MKLSVSLALLVLSVGSAASAQVMAIPGSEPVAAPATTPQASPVATPNTQPGIVNPSGAPAIVQPGQLQPAPTVTPAATFVLSDDGAAINPVVKATLRGHFMGQGLVPTTCEEGTVVVKVNDYYTACAVPSPESTVQPGRYQMQLKF